MENTRYSGLNPAQERKIESVHGGFLYQHLYTVGCLLMAGSTNVLAVVVERDEDIELVRPDSRDYIQVKTRSRPLIFSDIRPALERFDLLRTEHTRGEREGGARFYFVANQPPGPELLARLGRTEWPADVVLLWPGCAVAPEDHPGLPPAWAGVGEATQWCVVRAEAIHFGRLAPETLVWKLAAQVTLAASGGAPFQNHTFATESLGTLFEQFVIWLQDFPALPDRYYAQENEPRLASDQRVRIIEGFSGAGKSTWASNAVSHSGGVCAYFDGGKIPVPAIPLALAKEIAARMAVSSADLPLSELMRADASGGEIIRLLDLAAGRLGINPVIVIDNAHLVSEEILSGVVSVTANLKFVLLCQPSGSIQGLETMLGIARESLEGWDEDTVASVVSDLGAHGSPESIKRLRGISAGMPLYVLSAVRVALADYGADIGRLCTAISQQTHTTEIAQEWILSKVFDLLPENVRDVITIMSFSEVGLSQAELEVLLEESLGFKKREVASMIRTLRPMGILMFFSGGKLRIHDAMRLVGKRHFDDLSTVRRDAVLTSLTRLLTVSLSEERDTKRLSMLIRTSVAHGDYQLLIGFAGLEMFHELGIEPDIWELLEGAANSGVLGPKQRFEALDGLAFRALKIGSPERAEEVLSRMGSLLESGELDRDDRLDYLLKRMQCQATIGDAGGARRTLDEIEADLPEDPTTRRILRYSEASALWQLGDVEAAERILRILIGDYYRVLGITKEQIFGRPVPAIHEAIRESDDYQANAKRFADALEFHARALSRLTPLPQILPRVQAMKFYKIVGADESLVRVGMDVVDDHLTLGDIEGAKSFMENYVMPYADNLDLAVQRVFVHSQYAVVLARCGDQQGAEATLARLRPYYEGANEEERQGLMLNERLVREANAPRYFAQESAREVEVGRNDPCPCGSGLKFKRCHGR